jgi:multidrug efflux pump
MKDKDTELFENSPVLNAILRLAVPTVIGQIILVIYNMADTYFIGLTGSDAMLTAVTVCMPAFMFISAISNLFGIGGAATISQALGKKDTGKAANASAFALYGCLLTMLAYAVCAFAFRHSFIDALGGSNPEVHVHAIKYLMVTVVFGGLFTAVGTLLSHLIRSEGRSIEASTGIAVGGILNVLLDPLFMFVILPKGNEALGAAIATALSNVIVCLYFVFLIIRLQKTGTCLTFRFNDKALTDKSAFDIVLIGLPACLMTLFENISYALLDHLMAQAGMAYQAGVGVAKKVNMLAHCIVRGMSQGVLPLIAYNYAAGNYKRMKHSILISSAMSVSCSILTMAICLLFTRQLIGIFINNEGASLYYGMRFLQILCIGCPFSAFAYAVISFFQAIGESRRSFFLATLRKGALDIPLMIILNHHLPAYGIVMATPITDVICCIVAVISFIRILRHIKSEMVRGETEIIHA